MPFGILECNKLEQGPGTSFMHDQDELPPEYAHIPRDALKHGTGRFKNIILVPRPSDSPNDPLNWPQWKKDMILLIIRLSAAVVGAFGPMLSPGFVEILSQATAWLILTIRLALFLTNPLAKPYICVSLTKRNTGIYEPEFLLVLVIVVIITGTVGFFGFGATVHHQTHRSGPVLTLGLANMSLAFASTCVFGYAIEAYPKFSEEAFVAINARNLLTFGLTYFVNTWLAQDRPLAVLSILGALCLFVCLLTIPR